MRECRVWDRVWFLSACWCPVGFGLARPANRTENARSSMKGGVVTNRWIRRRVQGRVGVVLAAERAR